MLKPLAEEVGAPWAGWHTLRHTFASLQLAGGCNVVALSRALGHHTAAFTLSTYVHLLRRRRGARSRPRGGELHDDAETFARLVASRVGAAR